jgi:choline dehydrogenase-like flavoprotein
MSPWYAAAEVLFRVRGTPDPLRTDDSPGSLLCPPPLTEANAELFQFLVGRGLHPYQLHMACEALPDCATCQGYLCDRSCKNDAGRICLLPALTQYEARLLSGCRVLRLEAGRSAVERVICDWQGRPLALKGKLIVLAAGALVTPALLLSSSSPAWPNGLANESGLVGRNLMRHCFDMLMIRAQAGTPLLGKHKEIAFSDFYASDGQKLGAVQSLGVLPPVEAFANGLGPIALGFRMLWPIAAPIWRARQRRTLILAMIMEDLPYHDNWVRPMETSRGDARQRVRFRYQLGRSEQARLKQFRGKVLRALAPYKPRLLKGATTKTGVQHVCGTCRFGVDPATSVLDPMNRAHGLSNLYVTDASFFPSSSGINPALTIAANALRVATHIDRERL